MPAKRNLVVIENTTIQSLLSRPDVVRLFPNCLKLAAGRSAGRKTRTCGRCSSKRRQTPDYSRIRHCLASLNGDNRRRLKEILNAKQIRITHRTSAGQEVRFTF